VMYRRRCEGAYLLPSIETHDKRSCKLDMCSALLTDHDVCSVLSGGLGRYCTVVGA
jgi:hypothetical protein